MNNALQVAIFILFLISIVSLLLMMYSFLSTYIINVKEQSSWSFSTIFSEIRMIIFSETGIFLTSAYFVTNIFVRIFLCVVAILHLSIAIIIGAKYRESKK